MKLFPLTLAVGLAMASTLAFASHHGAPPAAGAPMPGMGMGMDHGMMAMDKMSPEQHQKAMDAMFAQMDANGDGSVTKAEFTAHHAKKMAEHRAMMDAMHKQMHTPPAAAPAAKPDAKTEAKPDAQHKH